MKKNSFPEWLKKRLPAEDEKRLVKDIIGELQINTVCQSAECPNQGECFANGTATFLILGNSCTRNCKFCAIHSSAPEKVDSKEPEKIAKAVRKLNLQHVIITSVTRDDLEYGGVDQFIKTINEIKKVSAGITVEILTPDFKGNFKSIKKLAQAEFEVFNHNIETVPGLYDIIRPEADYYRSLDILYLMKSLKEKISCKSGIMLGLGEKKEEVIQVMKDLRDNQVEIITIGQYLQPSAEHFAVKEFITPAQFSEYKSIGIKMGFKSVIAGPFVRSSYKAAEMI